MFVALLYFITTCCQITKYIMHKLIMKLGLRRSLPTHTGWWLNPGYDWNFILRFLRLVIISFKFHATFYKLFESYWSWWIGSSFGIYRKYPCWGTIITSSNFCGLLIHPVSCKCWYFVLDTNHITILMTIMMFQWFVHY